MAPTIQVHKLSKHFRVAQKGQGFGASLKSLFHREYKLVKAVENVSFEIEEGEMVAFLGPNGAGKTTTLKMLSGILYPSAGHVKILGFIPQEHKNEFKKQISLVMGQKNQLWWDLPATDTFLLNKDIYQISDDQYSRVLAELTELLDVQHILATPVRKLSLGERMKCELIASMLHQPKVIFLDEPTIGLDIAIQKKIRAFLREYNRKTQATIILTSHYMDDVKEVCDRVILIDHGKKVYDDKLKQLIANFAQDKYLKLDFDEEVQRKDLEKYGQVVDFNGFQATISVPRQDHTKKAAAILEHLPVINIDIQEIELEDIILKSFSTEHK